MKRQLLIDILTKVKPGLSDKDFIEQSDHFIFKDNNVYTYNDRIAIGCPIELDTEDVKVCGTVKANEFYNLLQKIKDDEIELYYEPLECSKTTDRSAQLLVKGKKIKAGIQLLAEFDDSLLEISSMASNIESWFDLPNNFISAIKASIFSCSTDASTGALSCLNITKNSVISSDNLRITKYELSGEMEDLFLLPIESAQELVKYKPVRYAVESNWVHFKNKEDTLFSCRIGAGDYPDVSHLLEANGEEITLPKELKDVVERTEVLTSSAFDHDKVVDITIKNNSLLCRGEGEYGWAEEEVEIEYSGPDIKFTIHPTFLKDIVSRIQKGIINEDLMWFKGEDFIHMITLMEEE